MRAFSCVRERRKPVLCAGGRVRTRRVAGAVCLAVNLLLVVHQIRVRIAALPGAFPKSARLGRSLIDTKRIQT